MTAHVKWKAEPHPGQVTNYHRAWKKLIFAVRQQRVLMKIVRQSSVCKHVCVSVNKLCPALENCTWNAISSNPINRISDQGPAVLSQFCERCCVRLTFWEVKLRDRNQAAVCGVQLVVLDSILFVCWPKMKEHSVVGISHVLFSAAAPRWFRSAEETALLECSLAGWIRGMTLVIGFVTACWTYSMSYRFTDRHVGHVHMRHIDVRLHYKSR